MPRHLSRVLAAVTVLLGLPQAATLAQQGTTISGRVTSDRQAPLQSVSVAIATLGVGGFTDEQGRYSFTVPPSRTAGQSVQLAARRIGFQAKSVTITLSGGSITQDFALSATAAQLTGVVVTALSQQREKATIGTSQQAVSGEQLTQVQQPTLISALSGKVSGLQINQSGNMGGSQRIVIRGAGSILGENQPLFIVDGAPMSNTQFTNLGGGGATAGGGRDYGTGISDLNMDDVASVTVLKGPNAAALYGSRASNGAVVITTKNARQASRGTKFSFTSRGSVDQLSIFPKYQNQYGQGFGGEFQYVDGAGGGVNDGADESWGPKLDGRPIDQFSGKAQPWIAHPDNVRDFFRTGNTVSNNLTVSQSFENAGARLSITRDDIKANRPEFVARQAGQLAFRQRHDQGEPRRLRIVAIHAKQRHEPPGEWLHRRQPLHDVHVVRPSGGRSVACREVLQQGQPVRIGRRQSVQLERQLPPKSVLAGVRESDARLARSHRRSGLGELHVQFVAVRSRPCQRRQLPVHRRSAVRQGQHR